MSTNTATPKKPVVLCILDGFGYREQEADNAIKLANTPTYDRLWNSVPRAWLKTSGLAVGLPDGQMGNSEVGHMNLGGGRVVMQDLPRIDKAAETGELASNPELVAFIDALKASGGTAHLMGLMSPGGVHSHQDHMAALTKIIAEAGVPVRIHAFMDGRDTPPRSALPFLEKFEDDIASANDASIATMTGRYWAMDRDSRWDRVEKAYNAMVRGDAAYTYENSTQGIEAAYARDENDEFVEPTLVGGYAGMQDGDGLLMANFRADRAREILTTLVDPAFDGFDRGTTIKFAAQTGMVEYSSAHNAFLKVIFPSENIVNSLGETLANARIPQLRIAETEKYAHVTFFFNGGAEDPFEGEDRILIPSPDVATYDLKPEMSAPEVTDKLVEAIESGKYGAIIVNYANPDMVGHTGVLSAAIKAVETIDACITRLEEAVKKVNGAMIITADHGNVEQMVDENTGQPHTAHTNFDVPALLINHEASFEDGSLADVSPTLLSIMGVEQPTEMTGQSLVSNEADVRASA
ncbi:2,3-bisphosphoglycerate-independent phosphoglycerate mutase [Kordiimonas sp. SCSIO 12603]|uniref:2,3-bisphosphoglycerate-independent phosphoglycerate mutase n=1 Tax=Kordiimonas sp. SCSIO 12603 TaxID=2829596 RepID=UPI002105DC77|nr:2,3-bisphosphoglycerate-independent phosphoglycerate mutase [Kordiimonas sp. SCSIO 12603]UTW59734.1 2,3-bisphosphoglycerate-independent phosphoglycerate mutase [Kordiimonas sp. SCSIO 12603]